MILGGPLQDLEELIHTVVAQTTHEHMSSPEHHRRFDEHKFVAAMWNKSGYEVDA